LQVIVHSSVGERKFHH